MHNKEDRHMFIKHSQLCILRDKLLRRNCFIVNIIFSNYDEINGLTPNNL